MRTLFPADFGVLEFVGRDARSFLHAQLATDLRRSAAGSVNQAVLLGSNGRVLAAGSMLTSADAHFLWLLDRQLLQPIQAHLRRYILRSKLSIDINEELHLRGVGSTTSQENHFVDAAARCLTLGTESEASGDHESALFAQRAIDVGLLDFAAQLHDRYLPQALGLHRFGGVALDKGCYPGQEIVARTHYLGKVKRSLARFRIPSKPNTATLHDERGAIVGELLNMIELGPDYCGLASIQSGTGHARLGEGSTQAEVSLTEFH